MVMALAGQGMALASDYVIQVAPMLSATAAGVETAVVADKALILSLITGIVAITFVYLTMRKQIRKPNDPINLENVKNLPGQEEADVAPTSEKWQKFFAVLVPLAMLGVMILWYTPSLKEEDLGALKVEMVQL